MQINVKLIADEQRLRPKDSEVFRLMGDNKLIKEITGWSPEYTLAQGLKETIKWFKNPKNLKKIKTNIYNL